MRRIASLLLILLWAGSAWAATGDADGTYTVTITKIEISQDGGGTYFTVFSGSQAINIASAQAGAVAGSLVNASGVPHGSYNRVRVTLGDSLIMRGFVNNGGTTFYTNNDADGFGLNGNAANAPGADYTTSTFTIPAANRTQLFSINFTCPGGGAGVKVRISFDASGVLSISGGLPAVGAPSVSISIT